MNEMVLPSTLAFYEKVAEDEHIHFRAQKTIERFFGAADDGFVFVEGGVEHEGDGGQRTEVRNQLMVKRVGFAMDGLQAAGAIDVTHGGE